MSKPLPVIDLLNNVRIVSNYLYASQQIQLTSYINQTNPDLATRFQNWQRDIFNEYFEGFIDENLTAQPAIIQDFYNDNFGPSQMQQLAQATFTPDGDTVPALITAADDVSSLITSGSGFVTQLTAIAKAIQNADQQQVDQLMAQAKQLSDQFDKDEQQIVDGSFKTGVDVVITAVNIAVAVGSEGADIQPVVKSISQVATDVVNEINLSDDAKETIGQLQKTWALLDAETSDLAQITLVINQLKAVADDTSAAMNALNEIVDDWQSVVDSTSMPADEWESYGNAAMNEWCARMVVVSFATVTQTVS